MKSRLSVQEMEERARKVKLLIMDVDGVLTTGAIILEDHSPEIKMFNAQDGIGLVLARYAGLKTAIITQRQSPAVERRARELKIDYLYMKTFYKLQAFENLRKTTGIAADEICYVGDDLPDLPIMRQIGFPVAVANANWRVKQEVPFETEVPGGQGAVREVVEFILQAQGKLEQTIEQLLQPPSNR